MKLLLALILLMCGTASCLAQDQGWGPWRSAFEQIARSKGLNSALECTPYQVGGNWNPERLLQFYRQGLSPEKAFEEIGCDVEVFEQVYMLQVRTIIAGRVYIPEAGSDDENEAFNEWLWLEYFLEGKPPKEAASAILIAAKSKDRE